MPNEVKVFGSTRYQTKVRNCEGSESQLLHIKKSHVKAVDHPSHHCNAVSRNISTSACIANFIEKEIGCNPNVYGSQYSKGPPCTTRSQLKDFVNLSYKLERSNDNDVYVLTGCLPSCERDAYDMIAEPMTCKYDGNPDELSLQLRITDRTYEEKEQYVIYDIDSFIADVGGYMGLLLGYSIMSLYNEIEALLKRLIPRTFLIGFQDKQ